MREKCGTQVKKEYHTQEASCARREKERGGEGHEERGSRERFLALRPSLGRGKDEVSSLETLGSGLGGESYPAKIGHPPEASLASCRGNLAARSVDRECAGRGNPAMRDFRSGSRHRGASGRLPPRGPPGCQPRAGAQGGPLRDLAEP